MSVTETGVRPVTGPILLGIDAGLSYLKVAAFNEQGRLVARGSRSYTTHRLALDRVEQDPEEWIRLSADIVRQMIAERHFQASQVAGLSVSARGSAGIFVNAAGQVIGPHWLDDRHREQARRLVEQFGPEADNRSLASRTLYFAETMPEQFKQLAHPLFARDFLLYRLTGTVATDPSSGPRGQRWPEAVWSAIGLPVERVPPVRPHTTIGGYLLPAVADQFGLPAGLPVGLGGHDGACANTGAGAILPGQVCLTMGTNGVARSITSAPAPTVPWRGISAYHFLPGRWCCGGDMTLLGHMPTWLARLLAENHPTLEAAARAVAPGASGITFLPYLNGQVCPARRSTRRAALLGLHDHAGRPELYRAVLEGAACLVRLVADRLTEYGLGQGEWRVSGGGANSRLWLEIIAALLERPLQVVEPEEGPRGACMFLAVALGWFASVEDCAAAWLRTIQIVTPDPALTAAYGPILERFRRLDALLAEIE